MKPWLRTVLLAALLAGASAAQGAAVLLNGGFEAGNFENGPEDWVVSTPSGGTVYDSWLIGNMSLARSGVENAGTPCQNLVLCLDPVTRARLWQDLDTHPGDLYLVGFWVANSNNTENGLNVYWGNDLVLALRNEGMPYEYHEVEVLAKSFSTRLMFTGFNNQAMLALDDVSLTVLRSVPVPEPGTLALLALSLTALAITHRRLLGRRTERGES